MCEAPPPTPSVPLIQEKFHLLNKKINLIPLSLNAVKTLV